MELANGGEAIREWRKACEAKAKTGTNLFWIGAGLIRQSVVRTGSWRYVPNEGPCWQEIDATKRLRRELQAQTG